MANPRKKKGADWERAVVKVFVEDLGIEAKRCRQYTNNHGLPDVEAGKWWIECKRTKSRAPITSAFQQACEDCPSDKVPLAITKEDRKPALVTMRLSDFIELIREN